ncbi:MAG: NCS2 family permease [Clostridiaceae bacterium]|nr:NCS2 family permease [Clostridiaceae bacterium]
MDEFFKLKEKGTNVRTEIIAGLTTFFTMAYIIFVNPQMLGITGMDKGGVFVATVLASVIGTLIMGLVANVPYATAPGMGLNAFFTYTVCLSMQFKWQEALAMVFICGLINILITVTQVRKAIIKAIPASLQHAIGGGIGLFIAYIGIKNAGFIDFTIDPGTYSSFDKTIDPAASTIIAKSSAVPAMVNFTDPAAQLALIGLVIIVILMVLKIKGSMLIGIILTTIIGIPMGITVIPDKLIDLSAVGGIKNVSFSFFGSTGLASLFSDPARIPMVLITIFAFSLSDTFDTIGTFIGTGRKSGIFDENDEKALNSGSGFKSRMDRALFADSTATSIGALLGTSNTTTYVESSAGIGVGGRTGLTSITVAVLFLLCLPFASVIGIVPAAATAPALIIVGILMAEVFGEINWKEFEEAIPAFLTVAIMAFAYSISYGIAAGFIFYCIIKLVRGKGKEVHPILYGASILFLVNFILMYLQKL